MTPLMPAPASPAPQVLPAPGGAGSPPPAGEDSFALALLGQEKAALHPVSKGLQGELATRDEAPMEEPGPAVALPDQQVLPLQPAPPWPPAGLAGLLLSADGRQAGAAPGAMALAAAPAPAGAGAAPAPVPDIDLLAVAGTPAPGVEAAAAAEDPGPPPAPFTVPPPTPAPPAREAAPMLAARCRRRTCARAISASASAPSCSGWPG